MTEPPAPEPLPALQPGGSSRPAPQGGTYGNGDPHTFTEGRTCPDCAIPLPDITGRWGSFSPRCPPCRAAHKPAQRTKDYHRKKPKRGAVVHAPEGLSGAELLKLNGTQTPARDRSRRTAIWKNAVCEGVAAGKSTAQVLRELQVTSSAFEQQRQRDDTFRAEHAYAVLQGRVASTIPEDERASDDFGTFSQTYFHRTHFKHQLLLAETMQSLQPLDVVLVLMAPESGKTSTIEDYMCRKIALDPAHRFRVISEAQDLAVRIVGACKRKLTDVEQYPSFVTKYGPFYEKGQERSAAKPWTSNQIAVWKNPGSERDYNLVAQSWSGANYGSRIDTLIIDDVVSQRNVGESQKIFERIRGTFFNRGKQMRTIIVGTRIKPGDFYDLMLDAGLVTRQIIVPAIGGLGAEPGEPSTPEMWEYLARHNGGSCLCRPRGKECPNDGSWLTPKEYLEVTRFRSGEETWWASYMQNPRDDAVSVFGAAIDGCKDPERIVAKKTGDGLTVLSIDPALGGGTALVCAEHTGRRLRVIDARTRSGLQKTEEQLELISEFATKYRPSLLIVEFDAQQKGLGNDDRLRAMGTRLGFTILPHITRGQKFDVPYAVASMNQSFVRGEISIPWGDDETRDRMHDLVYQLRGWRIPEQGKRDRQVQDLVMALWFQWRHWMLTREGTKSGSVTAKRPSWLMSDLRKKAMARG